MTNPEEDFTSRGWLVAAATLAVLIVVSFIPPINAGGVRLRRASIISDLITFSADSELTEALAEAAPEINVDDFEVDLEQVAKTVANTTASASPLGEATSASWEGIFDEQPTGGDFAESNPQGNSSVMSVSFADILPAEEQIISKSDLTRKSCERALANDLRSHLREVALVAIAEFLEKIFARDYGQHGIAEKFKSLGATAIRLFRSSFV